MVGVTVVCRRRSHRYLGLELRRYDDVHLVQSVSLKNRGSAVTEYLEVTGR